MVQNSFGSVGMVRSPQRFIQEKQIVQTNRRRILIRDSKESDERTQVRQGEIYGQNAMTTI